MRAGGVLLLSVLMVAGNLLAATNSTTTSTSTPKAPTGPVSNILLTDEEIAALQTQWTDPKNPKHTMSFHASLSPVRFDPKKDKNDISRYAKSGKVPIKIYATLLETKEKGGKPVSMRNTEGKAYFYLLDDTGKLALKESASLGKLCAS